MTHYIGLYDLNRKWSCFCCFSNLFENSLNLQCIHDISHLLWIFDENIKCTKYFTASVMIDAVTCICLVYMWLVSPLTLLTIKTSGSTWVESDVRNWFFSWSFYLFMISVIQSVLSKLSEPVANNSARLSRKSLRPIDAFAYRHSIYCIRPGLVDKRIKVPLHSIENLVRLGLVAVCVKFDVSRNGKHFWLIISKES